MLQMRFKTHIIFSLLLAYSLMLGHSFIPHHHHETEGEANHKRHEYTPNHTHDHQHSHDNEDHGDHTSHFVHSPGTNYYVHSSKELLSFNTFVLINDFHYRLEELLPGVLEIMWHPESPPPLLQPHYTSILHRGPPVII